MVEPPRRARPRRTASSPGAIQANLTKTWIAPDLLAALRDQPPATRAGARAAPPRFPVIVELNNRFPGSSQAARAWVIASYLLNHPLATLSSADAAAGAVFPADGAGELFEKGDRLFIEKSLWTTGYLFASLSRKTIAALPKAEVKVGDRSHPLVYKIWSEHRVQRCVYASVRTVKCDAARAAFSAAGEGIVWAVADTGVDGSHPHFATHDTLVLPNGLSHRDFTEEHDDEASAAKAALTPTDGHGTHVAGIIAGETRPGAGDVVRHLRVHHQERISDDDIRPVDEDYPKPISGMAPLCKILSLKVLKASDDGDLASLLAAIGYIQKVNEFGRDIKIHGLNLSLGYSFDPEWFAAGQSPLCAEVNRLVRSGVAVVVAAGNAGLTTTASYSGSAVRVAQQGTIADPGNAELAITVGSTHRDAPHTYGVSYFSAKGPTGDGRMKPDLLAPGERIVSCSLMQTSAGADDAPFHEDSGTSMAAPHVSGSIAAFLSVRREFIGQPERVKDILLKSATDLGRQPSFQGAGLIDLMRALQSV